MKESTSKLEAIVEDCEELMLLTFGEDYIITRIKDDNDVLTGFISKDFSLHYFKEKDKHDGLFYLSFIVGTKCRKASEVTCLLTAIINFEYIYQLDDFYWDDSKKQMLFGDDAVYKKYDDMLEKSGKAKCPVCEGVLSKSLLVDGFCKSCSKEIVSRLTWH